ncbi:MAG: DUF72 domain-containing protein [Gammaproteobacteria bacterium]|jgi:uncharacterized protein YecE (DUF72 family)
MSRAKAKIFIGTSGWSYNHWRGAFYPHATRNDQMLEYYLQHFRSTEINNTFYHLPEKKTLQHWHELAPKGFVFSVKASRYITHMKKLKDPRASTSEFFNRITILGDRLGPVLFQLPPKWKFNEARFSEFLQSLSRDFRYTFEFRDRSWINPQVLELLSQYQAAFCIYELNGYMSPKEITTDFVYIRLHGPNGPYEGSYSKRTLSGWAGVISAWQKRGLSTYCYFDNDQAGYAPDNALSLSAMLDERQDEK